MKNCRLLFDPTEKMPRKLLVDFIDENKNNKIYIYSFIVNTCEIVKDMSKEHVEAVSHLYKYLDEAEAFQCAE